MCTSGVVEQGCKQGCQSRDVSRPRLRAFGTWLQLGGILEISPLSVGSRMPFKSGLGSIQESGGMLLSQF